jgi:hypothetical protein
MFHHLTVQGKVDNLEKMSNRYTKERTILLVRERRWGAANPAAHSLA